jgi:3-hexulose-6-phosphate synthase
MIVADLKVTDGAVDEVNFAASAGANAVTVMGSSPPATLNKFLKACRQRRIYSMIDMLGVINPLKRLLPLTGNPDVVVIHKGRDQEDVARAIIRYKDISKIKSKFSSFISVAGGLLPKKVRVAFFNGADIAILNVISASDPNEGIPDSGNIQQLLLEILQEVGN